MNIFQRFWKQLTGIQFPSTQMWNLFLPRTKYNYQREVGTGLESAVIMAPVRWISRRFSEAPMIINKNDEVLTEHPMLDLWRRPNPFYSGRLMERAIALSWNLDGNAYLVKLRNSQLRPVQLWWIPWWMISPHWPENGSEFIDYYLYKPEGKEIRIDPADVVHLRNDIDPRNTRKGLSPLNSLFREVFTDDEAANFTAALVRNFGIPGLVISPGNDATVKTDTADAIKAAYKEKFGGDRRGEPLILTSKTDVKQLSFSPQALDLGRLRQIPEERVTAIFGVPAAVVGFGTGLEQTKVGATMREMREAAYEDCIIPMQNVIAEDLDMQLLPDFDTDRSTHVGYDLSDVRVLQEDENKHAERLRGLVSDRIITVAEARKELGYEVAPSDEVFLQRINVLVVPAAQSLDQISAAAGAVDSGNNGNGQGTAGDLESVRVFAPAGPFVKTTPEARARLAIALVKEWVRLSDIWETELIKDFDRLGADAAAAIRDIFEERGIETFAFDTPETKQVDPATLAELLGEQVNAQDYLSEYNQKYLRIAVATYEAVESITGLGVKLTDQAELRIIAEGGTRRGLVDMNQQMKDSVFKAMEAAREAGEGPYQAILRFKDEISAGPWKTARTRAKVIARTETKYAQNICSLEAYKSAETVTAVQVVDAQLGETDDFCMQIDGAIVTFAEADSLAIEEHPNGTRSFTPIVSDNPRFIERMPSVE